MLICLMLLSAFVACDNKGDVSGETSAQTSAESNAQTSEETSAQTSAQTSEESSAETVNYEITQSEWNALFSGDTFKNVTASTAAQTYANDVLPENSTTYGTVKLAANSLHIKNQYADAYVTAKDGVWYLVSNEGTAWYGAATEEPYYNVASNHIFDYMFETEGFYANMGQYTDFTYDANNKCYSRDLGVISNTYHMTVKTYFENGALVKIEYISEWTADSYEFKSVRSATFSDYGTTAVTVPAWTAAA